MARSDYELAQSVIDDPSIEERHKVGTRAQIKICMECPTNRDKCWSCGFWPWWITTGTQPPPNPK